MTARRRRKKRHMGLKILLVVIVLGFVVGYGLTAPVFVERTVTILVPPKATTSAISQLLMENKVIHSAWAFKIYTKIKGLEGKLKAGEYTFNGQVSLRDIKEKMLTGDMISQNFTIPEGYQMEQITDLLAKKGMIDKDKFLDVADNGSFSYQYLPPAGTKDRLEGFLFPDTYQIIRGSSEEQIINMMLKKFDTVFSPQWRKQANSMDMSIREIVILASIIEREAKVSSDRAIISSVFYNRLKQGMHLESCATIQFALGEVKEVLLYKDLKIDSPYNTYVYGGLPPGPIASPGKDSLQAALYPAKTNYLYFVAKQDGSHYFSRTLAEHNEAKRKYLK